MDSNERKIVQELVTVLGCVIPASDGYEPRTNLWNKYTAAKNMLAAAPQVVADERELPVATWFAIDHADGVQFHPSEEQALRYSESGQCVKYFSEDQMRAALQAAPVQAQEPVAETYAHTMSNGRGRPDDPAPFETVCVRLLRNDLPASLKLYAAPVQPVAVPDGWKLVPIRATGVQREAARTKLGFAAMYEAAVAAAPAAHGDAETIRQAAFKEAIDACYKATPDRAKVRHIGEAAHYSACADAIRAIAAKAAS